MTKRNRIIYRIATAWLCLGMLSTGLVQLFKVKGEIEFILDLGYPAYFLTIIGAWKILGAIAMFIPNKPLLKEWAYAGFFFLMSGAVFSHIAMGSSMSRVFPALLLLTLTLVSWFFRPRKFELSTEKRMVSFNPQ
jgi:hypothetical protein